jgi:tetratricopeptide (TPR) repeat protein
LGEVARSRGDYQAAREAYEEALSLQQIAGTSPAYLMINLGHVAHSQKEYGRSASLFAQSLVLSFKDEDNHGTLACLAGLAATAADQGELQRAGRLFGATGALISALGVRLDVADRLDYERHLAQVLAQFEREPLESAWAEGQLMSLEEAVAFAFSLPTLQVLLG